MKITYHMTAEAFTRYLADTGREPLTDDQRAQLDEHGARFTVTRSDASGRPQRVQLATDTDPPRIIIDGPADSWTTDAAHRYAHAATVST